MGMSLSSLRVGNGFDVHAFADDRKLILGGIEIPHKRGLLGHSDADVVLHAVIDSILGATSKGDIGSWFPDSKEEFKDIDSKILFERVWEEVAKEGWSIINCDIVIMAQAPKINPHIELIQASIARLFRCSHSQIGVKATTTEKLGFVGREEGIACSVVILLQNV